MELESIQTFLTVARTKSISKAAQVLHISQPALSTRLKRIEEGLGFTLLERTWEGVKLTKQGEYYMNTAIQQLQDIRDTVTVLTGDNVLSYEEVAKKSECLQIGIDKWLVPMFVTPLIEILSQKFPNIEYKFITKSSQSILKLLEYSKMDIGIIYNDGNEAVHNLYTNPLVNDEMVLLYHKKEKVDLNQKIENISLLKENSFLLFDNPFVTYHSYFIKSLIESFGIQRFHIVDDIHVAVQIVTCGNGYTILPKSSVYPYINNQQLPIHIIPLGKKGPDINIQLALSSDRKETELISKLKEAVEKGVNHRFEYYTSL